MIKHLRVLFYFFKFSKPNVKRWGLTFARLYEPAIKLHNTTHTSTKLN